MFMSKHPNCLPVKHSSRTSTSFHETEALLKAADPQQATQIILHLLRQPGDMHDPSDSVDEFVRKIKVRQQMCKLIEEGIALREDYADLQRKYTELRKSYDELLHGKHNGMLSLMKPHYN
jgi:hypothetical protein